MQGLREKVWQGIGRSGAVVKDQSCVQSTLTVEIQRKQRRRGHILRSARVLIEILGDKT